MPAVQPAAPAERPPSIPPDSGSPRRSRPEAPAFSFGPPLAAPVAGPASAPAPSDVAASSSAPSTQPEGSACPVCGSPNPSLYRFCAVCGATLTKAAGGTQGMAAATADPPAVGPAANPVAAALAAPPQALVPAPPVAPPKPSPTTPPADPIVPAPVVQIADPAAAPRVTVFACARCQGQNDYLAKFCKYCGAPMAGTAATPAPAPVAPKPAPSQPGPPSAAPAPVPIEPAPPAPKPIAAAPIPAPSPVSPSGLGLVPAAANGPSAPRIQPRPPSSALNPVVPGPVAGAPGKSSTSEKTGPHPLVKASEIAAKLRAHGAPPPAGAADVNPALLGAQAPQADTIQTRAPDLRGDAPTTSKATARLVVVVEDGSDGKTFELHGPEVIVGRSECDVLLFDDPYVSPRHAKLVEQGGRWTIHDLRSTNGVFLRTRGRKPVESGDLILLGSQVLQFQLVSDEERQMTPAVQHGTRVFGTKPVPRVARLDQRSVTGLIADVYYVYRDETILGRETGDLVFTQDAFLSRRHAALRREPATNRFHLEDLDSSNGTYVAIRGEAALTTGDRVRIGQHLFRFESGA